MREGRYHDRRYGGVALLAAAAAGAALLGTYPASHPAAWRLRGPSSYRIEQRELQSLGRFLHPTLEANRKAFTGLTGPVTGFGAGEAYPQIWLRDSATLVPLTRWFYARELLTTWIEEHLAAQTPDGAVHDWIAAGEAAHFRPWAPRVRGIDHPGGVALAADTNTTEADQATSVVQAACHAFAATGDVAWLRKDVAGLPLLQRLDRALQHVRRTRWNARHGLLENALTADWGDVSPTYPDQRAIYQDARTPRAVGLYTNALFVQAARCLAELYVRAGRPEAGAPWRQVAQGVAAAVNKLLWQARPGFYRMHVVTTPELARGFPDDRDVFALGGNAVAVLAGIASDDQAHSIFDTAEERSREQAVSTIASVLLPPYADGTFRHPVMAQEWQYQNGGQWDWFAGRMILAEYLRGRSEQATAHLVQIAARVHANGGLFEWNTRAGQGRGSATYAGSAGALGQALIEGLFGVALQAGRLDLRVRLGGLNARVNLHQPASGARLAYAHTWDAARREQRLDYRADIVGSGRLAVRLPPDLRPREMRLDGVVLPIRTERVGADTFVVLETDWAGHSLELRLGR